MISKIFLTLVVAVPAFAQISNPETELPAIVRLDHLKEEYLNSIARETQSRSKAISSKRRLRALWGKAEAQLKSPACSHWSVPYAVERAKFIMSYDNDEVTENEMLELQEINQQLDENGCCAFLPESARYRVQN